MKKLRKILGLSLLALCFSTTSLIASAENFIEGQDYQRLSEVPKTKPRQEVLEFFSYGCPWCYRLEAQVQQWRKTKGTALQFNKVPVIFKPDWEYYAKAYYAAEALSEENRYGPILFKAIQEDNKNLNSNSSMIAFLSQAGMNSAFVESAFLHSPSISLKVNEAKQQMGQWQISAIPAFVVNQQFRTDLQMAKSETRLFALLDYLLKK